jgi:hypothetical protein
MQWAPYSANVKAIASPIPLLAPVIRAILFSSEKLTIPASLILAHLFN